MKIRMIIGAGAIALVSAAAAYAHGGATGVVKERMEAMEKMGDAVKRLATMMRGATAYDAATVKTEAITIRKHAGDAITKLFPEDSDGKSSEAKPGIWSDWEEFAALAKRLETLATGLEAAADNGPMQGGGSMMGNGSGTMNSGSGMMSGGMMGSGSSMAGGGRMGANAMQDANTLGAMPADRVFVMMTQTCSTCHTKFRSEKN